MSLHNLRHHLEVKMASNKVSQRRKTMTDEEAVQRLIEHFGNMVDLEIIQSIALSCNYNLELTSNILYEISSNIGAVPKQPKQGKKNKHLYSYGAAVSSNPPKNNNDDVIIVSEQLVNCSPNKMDTNLYTIPLQKKAQPSTSPQRKSKKEQEFDRIVLHVRQGSRILILMRGLPGSGKSYLSKEIVNKGLGCADYSTFILSTDDYFINRRSGRYEYDPIKISSAHEWNQQRAYKTMSKFISPVIIDNTNLQAWEMKPYVMMAISFGYSIEIVEPFTHWAFNDKELARRNSHGVPKAKIKDMIDRYEKNITSSKLLALWNLSYRSHLKPPISRSYPPIQHNVMQYNGNTEGAMSNSALLPHADNANNSTVANYENNKSRKTKSSKTNENFNLMDFDVDVLSSQSVYVSAGVNNMTKLNCNSVDSILMHEPTYSTDILKPYIWNSEQYNLVSNVNASEPEMKKARTYSNFGIDNTRDKSPSNGSQEDSVTQLTPQQIDQARNLYPKLNLSSWGLPENAVSSWESWDVVRPLNFTEEFQKTDFEQLNSHKSTFLQTSDSTTNTSSADFALLTKNSVLEDVKLLRARNRNINEGVIVPPPMSPPKKTLLDKSSMTNEDVLSAALCRERDANDEKQIQELVSLFPTIPVDYLRDVYEKCKKDLNWTVDLLLDDNKELLPALNLQISSPVEELSAHPESESLQTNMEALTIAPEQKNVNDHVKKEDVEEIKRHLEGNIEINNDYYSEHVLKIKNLRHGITNKPSTSKALDFDTYCTSSGEVIAVNSDVELDNFEVDIEFPENEEEEMMELNLGEGVVSQLEAKFGFPEMFPKGFLPVVHVPVLLARQLHALYVESVLVQMENQNQVLETIIKEDEEFAKKLHMQEQSSQLREGAKTPDLQEIMDEQVASNLYQKETEEWKKLTPDNLAARLTRQKLYAAFPTVDKVLLTEILHAHNNSYKDTIDVLLASTEHDKIYDPEGTIRDPPLTENVVIEMKKAEEEVTENVNAPDTPKSANEYRDEASRHLQKHDELIQKAQQAFQCKQYEVAQFYSDLAKTYTQLYDQANNLAASAFLQEHSQKLQNFSTLDLHYLYVKEAIAALDMFIDTNIQLLQGTNKKCENLFVITGRGKRSDQGISRIKPAVMTRLRKRDIWYMEVNPGLLKIRVRPHSAVTSTIP